MPTGEALVPHDFYAGEAVVVGAGVGGLCTAARLADAGFRVVLIERQGHVGGRWSTRYKEGFKLPTGAFLIAMDDPLAETFSDLGLKFPVRPITERTVYLVDGKLVGTGERGGLRALVGAAAEADGSDADAVMGAIRAALAGTEPTGPEPLPEWLRAHGAGRSVIGAIHALCQAFMALNAKEVSARAFFDYLRATAGRGHHGIPPGGSRQLADILATYVRQRGGKVLMESSVVRFLAGEGRVTGAVLQDGREFTGDVVVSDVGIASTTKLLPGDLAGQMPAGGETRGAPGITTFVASPEPFFDRPAIVTTGTRCVCLVTTPTLVAPELAPEGWHVTELISTFESSEDESDPKREMERHLADQDDIIPGWREKGRLVQRSIYRRDWPVYRSWPGTDPQERFPVPGLVLVGDSVKPAGFAGTGASAETARLAVDGILMGTHRHDSRKGTADVA